MQQVYDEYVVKGIFIEELPELIYRSTGSY